MNKLSPSHKLFTAQLITHGSVFFMLIYGSFSHFFYSFLVFFLTGCFGMTMTYHRLLSHQSWNPPKWFYYLGVFFGVYGLTGSPIAWPAIHREHHRYADREQDPHSPYHQGFFRVQFLSMFKKPQIKYVVDLARDPYLKFLHVHYWKIHCFIAFSLIILEPFSIVYLYLFPAFLLWHAGSFVNTLSHLWGKRRYEIADKSRNNALVSLFCWGEGWHNNHHARPSSPYFSRSFWEFDPGGFFIRLLNRK